MPGCQYYSTYCHADSYCTERGGKGLVWLCEGGEFKFTVGYGCC